VTGNTPPRLFEAHNFFEDEWLVSELTLWYLRTQSPKAETDFKVVRVFEAGFLAIEGALMLAVDSTRINSQQKLVLTPQRPAKAWLINHVTEPVELESGQSLDLTQHRSHYSIGDDIPKPSEHYPQSQSYFGDGHIEMSTLAIARALSENARWARVDELTGQEIQSTSWAEIVEQ
jgi:hypothetical protein